MFSKEGRKWNRFLESHCVVTTGAIYYYTSAREIKTKGYKITCLLPPSSLLLLERSGLWISYRFLANFISCSRRAWLLRWWFYL